MILKSQFVHKYRANQLKDFERIKERSFKLPSKEEMEGQFKSNCEKAAMQLTQSANGPFKSLTSKRIAEGTPNI